jgi:hypothetical protein
MIPDIGRSIALFECSRLFVLMSDIKMAYGAMAEFNLYCVQRFSSYRAVNTLRLGYKNQSVNAV